MIPGSSALWSELHEAGLLVHEFECWLLDATRAIVEKRLRQERKRKMHAQHYDVRERRFVMTRRAARR